MKFVRLLYRIQTPLLVLILLCFIIPINVYSASVGTISASKNHVDEGSSLKLTTNMTGTVTWSSSNSNLATVSSSGVVTGVKAGVVTITASCANYSNATFTVYVTIPDGLYYIKNASSSLCLYNDSSNAKLYTKYTGSTTRIPQLWKISYISNGLYAVRPIVDLSRALGVNSGAYAYSADTVVSNTSLSSSYKWTIKWNSFGYYFQQNGNSAKTLIPVTASSSGSLIYAGSWTSTPSCHWNLESAKGVFLRDSSSYELLDSSVTKNVQLGDSYSLSDASISYDYYGALTSLSWSSGNSSIAAVTSSGKVTGGIIGETSITLKTVLGGTTYTTSYTCSVTPNNAVLLAIVDSDGSDRSEYFANSKEYIETTVNSKSTNVNTITYQNCTEATMIRYLQSYDYFVIHTHGSKTGFKINGTTANNLTMSELSGTDLSNIDFALLLTCYTGQDFDSSHIINNTPVNIIEQMVICGAETVIGFNNVTKVTDCNRFAPALLERVFVDGMLLEEALDDISYLLYYYNMKERCEIAGDVDQVIR